MGIYISIPITGHDREAQERKARKFAETIDLLGHDPVIPFDLEKAPGYYNEREQYAFYMGEDIEQLLTCDAAYFARGWDKSKGCTLEHTAAKLYGLQAYYSLDKIPEEP